MQALPRPTAAPAVTSDVETLFRQTRRRRRRRRVAPVLFVAIAAVATMLWEVRGEGAAAPRSLARAQPLPGGPVVSAKAFSGQGLLAFASDGALYVLDGSNGALREVGRLRSGAEEPSFSHDDRWLAYIAAGRETTVYDMGEEAPFAPEDGPLVISSADGASARRVPGIGRVQQAVWSPTADLLLAVAATPYVLDGSVVWVVPPDGKPRKIFSGANIYGALWSPNGEQVAIAFGGSIPVRSVTLETVPLTGGGPTIWYHNYTDAVQWLVPLGWWKDQGMAAWVGGNGTAASGEGTLSGAELALISRPGAPLRELGHTPAIGLVPVTGSPTGWLAFENLWPNSWGRTPWAKGRVETCAPASDHCTPVPEPTNATAIDPTWSPDGRALAFVEASASQSPSSLPKAVRAWYASGRLYLLPVGTTKPVAVRGSQGATAPQWSPEANEALLYVSADSLYLVRKAGLEPELIASPLLPPKLWASTYYGQVDWRYMFAWAD